MKVKCIKHSDDILVFKSHYIVYGIRIYISHDNLQKIQYFTQWDHDNSYPLYDSCEYLRIINFDIPYKNWIYSKNKNEIIISYKEMAEDKNNFFESLVNGEKWAEDIHLRRKADIDSELKQINYKKLMGKYMTKLNLYKKECDKFNFDISDIISLNIKSKTIKQKIDYLWDNKESWIYIKADSFFFEANASSDNLLYVLKFAYKWLYNK